MSFSSSSSNSVFSATRGDYGAAQIITMYLSAIRKVRTCAYQDVRNVSFSENFTYVLNG